MRKMQWFLVLPGYGDCTPRSFPVKRTDGRELYVILIRETLSVPSAPGCFGLNRIEYHGDANLLSNWDQADAIICENGFRSSSGSGCCAPEHVFVSDTVA
jgi:hypothetical protein